MKGQAQVYFYLQRIYVIFNYLAKNLKFEKIPEIEHSI